MLCAEKGFSDIVGKGSSTLVSLQLLPMLNHKHIWWSAFLLPIISRIMQKKIFAAYHISQSISKRCGICRTLQHHTPFDVVAWTTSDRRYLQQEQAYSTSLYEHNYDFHQKSIRSTRLYSLTSSTKILSSNSAYINKQSKKNRSPNHGACLCSMINSSTGEATSDNVVDKSKAGSRTEQQSVSYDLRYRKNLLHEELIKLDCFENASDVVNFETVAQQTMLDPTMTIGISIEDESNTNTNTNIYGIQRYGKSSIKTCQTYYYPKNMNILQSYDEERWKIAATRTARQIEFLYQRHKAQQTQWIRNHDQTNTIAKLELGDDQTTSDISEMKQKESTRSKHFPFIILLDNLRSAENVGSIFRTADATKCQEVITIGITANPSNGNGITKIQKSALGAELIVPTKHFHNATTAVQYIQNTYCQYQTFVVETTSESIPYTDIQYVNSDGINSDNKNSNHGIVLIFGNEVTGVDVSFYMTQFAVNNIEERSNEIATQQQPHLHHKIQIIEIPMYGQKNSLNVAVCVSIILYEMIRQWNLQAKQ